MQNLLLSVMAIGENELGEIAGEGVSTYVSAIKTIFRQISIFATIIVSIVAGLWIGISCIQFAIAKSNDEAGQAKQKLIRSFTALGYFAIGVVGFAVLLGIVYGVLISKK